MVYTYLFLFVFTIDYELRIYSTGVPNTRHRNIFLSAMVYRLGITLTNFKDLTSPSGEILTTYVIRIMYNSDEDGKLVYEIEKRYSEFKNIYLSVKDVITPEYKFPNKSIFNNTAQFTKERRLRGFEELLHCIQRIDHLQEELHTFLELDFHIMKARAKHISQHRILYQTSSTASATSTIVSGTATSSVQSENELYASVNSNNHNNGTTTSNNNTTNTHNNNNHSHQQSLPTHFNALAAKKDQFQSSSVIPDELRVRKSLQSVSNYLIAQENSTETQFHQSSHTKQTDNHTEELSVDENIRLNPKKYLFFAAKVSAFTYVVVVLLGIVDISNAGISQILLTLLALFLLVLLLRIQYERGSFNHYLNAISNSTANNSNKNTEVASHVNKKTN